MKKVTKPDWQFITEPYNLIESGLDLWFIENIEPINEILAKAVRVYGTVSLGDELHWLENKRDNYIQQHQAYLIDIQPIKKDTAEDILRDLADELPMTMYPDKGCENIAAERFNLYRARVRALLEGEK